LIHSVYPCAEQWNELKIDYVLPAYYSRHGNLRNYRDQKLAVTLHNFSNVFTSSSYELQDTIDSIKNLTFSQYDSQDLTGFVDLVLSYSNSIEHLIMYIWLLAVSMYLIFPFISACFQRSIDIAESTMAVKSPQAALAHAIISSQLPSRNNSPITHRRDSLRRHTMHIYPQNILGNESETQI
jgi:hypothetical protein